MEPNPDLQTPRRSTRARKPPRQWEEHETPSKRQHADSAGGVYAGGGAVIDVDAGAGGSAVIDVDAGAGAVIDADASAGACIVYAPVVLVPAKLTLPESPLPPMRPEPWVARPKVWRRMEDNSCIECIDDRDPNDEISSADLGKVMNKDLLFPDKCDGCNQGAFTVWMCVFCYSSYCVDCTDKGIHTQHRGTCKPQTDVKKYKCVCTCTGSFMARECDTCTRRRVKLYCCDTHHGRDEMPLVRAECACHNCMDAFFCAECAKNKEVKMCHIYKQQTPGQLNCSMQIAHHCGHQHPLLPGQNAKCGCTGCEHGRWDKDCYLCLTQKTRPPPADGAAGN